MNNLFTIVFHDGTKFEGGKDYNDTKWLEIPDKKIKSLSYRKPQGDYLNLSGYEKYYQYIEACIDLNGKLKGQKRIKAIYLMGKLKKEVKIYRINFINNFIMIRTVNEDNDFIRKLNPIGWK